MDDEADPAKLARDAEELVTWRGKPIETMTREELIAALKMSARINRAAHEAHAHTLTTWASLAKARMARHG